MVFSGTVGASQVQQGSFETTVSDSTSQLLFAVDATDSIRGLSLSIPDVASGVGQPDAVFDARSTALGALFLTPGILTQDPVEAAVRAAELESYACLQPLVDHLATSLPDKSLNELAQTDPVYQDRLLACVEEWLINHPIPDPELPSLSLADVPATIASGEGGLVYDFLTNFHVPRSSFRLRIDEKEQNPVPWEVQGNDTSWATLLTRTVHTLANQDHRFVAVYRQDSLMSGAENWYAVAGRKRNPQDTQHLRDSIMGGAVNFSFGSLATFSFSKATTKVDTLDYFLRETPRAKPTDHWVKSSRYWVMGPGFVPPEPLPATFPDPYRNTDRAWGMTFTGYVVFPLASFLSGGKQIALDAEKTSILIDLWSLFEVYADGQASFSAWKDTFKPGVDWQDRAKAMYDLNLTIFKMILANPTAFDLFTRLMGISQAQVNVLKNFSTFLTSAEAALAAGNLIIAARSWYLHPQWGSIYLEGGGERYSVTSDSTSVESGGGRAPIDVLVMGLNGDKKWGREVTFKPISGEGLFRPASGGSWESRLTVDADLQGMARVEYRTQSTAGAVDSVSISINSPSNTYFSSPAFTLYEDTMAFLVVDENPDESYWIYTTGDPVPSYEVWGVRDPECQNGEGPNYWSRNIPKPGWELLGVGQQRGQSIYPYDFDCVILGTHTSVMIDAIKLPGGDWITYEYSASSGFRLKPEGVAASNVHKPYSYEVVYNPPDTTCTLEPGFYGYVDPQTGLLVNPIDFAGPRDGQADEMGLPKECYGAAPDHVFNGFFFLPNPGVGQEGGGNLEPHLILRSAGLPAKPESQRH